MRKVHFVFFPFLAGGLLTVGSFVSSQVTCPCGPFVITECDPNQDQMYCAIPNDPNILDNAAGIQRALDDANECAVDCGGATVEIPAGRFTLNPDGCQDLLTFGPKVAIRGQGIGISALVLVDGLVSGCTNGPAILATINGAENLDAQYFHVSGLTFEGNYPEPDDKDKRKWQGLKFNSVSRFTVTNCEFTKMSGNGLVIMQNASEVGGVVSGTSSRGSVDSCVSRDNHGEGYYIHGRHFDNGPHWDQTCQISTPTDNSVKSASGFTFTNNLSEHNDHVGFGIYDSEAVTFVGCVATGNGLEGLNRPGFSADSSRLVSYSGCVANTNKDGFRTAAARHCVPAGSISYSGCTASNNDRYGFNIVAAEGVAINGCQMISNPTAGFRVASGCSGQADSDINPFRVANTKRFSLSGCSISGSVNGGLVLGTDFGTIAGSVMLNLSQEGILVQDHSMSKCNGEFSSNGLMIAGSVIHGGDNEFAILNDGDNSERLHAYYNEVCPTEDGCQTGNPISFPTCDDCETADNFGNDDICE